MELSARQIRAHRLRAHHLDQKYPFGELLTVAGTCGLQNSPPGAWETAAFCRLKDCNLPQLHQALYQKKELLQAWSIRGVPLIFPTADSGVFLSPLAVQEGEEPWIYTKGIGLALDYLGMSFAELLPLVESAAEYLEDHTIKSKEELDRVLAQLAAEQLPAQKQSLWNAPSMYGAPDRQTVGGAAVSFLLRPCSFKGLVVFGEREGISPTFTSPLRWLGHKLVPSAQGTAELARRFLHAYGPATPRTFAEWLGSTPAQAKRLWRQIEEELEPVTATGKKAFILQADRESFRCADTEEALLLLGPHDPYLDIRDRAILLEDTAAQRQVWRTVGNPGVILKGGKIIGIWKTRTQREKLSVTAALWEPFSASEQRELKQHLEGYAAFRGLALQSLTRL